MQILLVKERVTSEKKFKDRLHRGINAASTASPSQDNVMPVIGTVFLFIKIKYNIFISLM